MILDTWFPCFYQQGGNILLRISTVVGTGTEKYTGDITTAFAKVVTAENGIRMMPVA